MNSIIEHDEMIVDLGAASAVTMGGGENAFDGLGTEQNPSGISDD